MFLRFGKNLKWKQRKIITTYTQNIMFYCQLTFLKKLEIVDQKVIEYVWVSIWEHQLWVGMQCSIWQKLSFNLFQLLECFYSFKKGTADGVYYIIIWDRAKPAISIWNLLTQNKN